MQHDEPGEWEQPTVQNSDVVFPHYGLAKLPKLLTDWLACKKNAK